MSADEEYVKKLYYAAYGRAPKEAKPFAFAQRLVYVSDPQDGSEFQNRNCVYFGSLQIIGESGSDAIVYCPKNLGADANQIEALFDYTTQDQRIPFYFPAILFEYVESMIVAADVYLVFAGWKILHN